MRWLVGWSSTADGRGKPGAFGGYDSYGGAYGGPDAYAGYGERGGAVGPDGETMHPVGSQLLWGDPDPLWAVGDWRPDEVRVVRADERTRIAVLGMCGASDEQLRVGLLAARGGALRHLTTWPGSYTAVVQVGRRITVCGDLAGARPVFHTPGRAARPTPRPPCRWPTSSRPTSTTATSPRCWPPPTCRPPCSTPPRTTACGAFRRGTR